MEMAIIRTFSCTVLEFSAGLLVPFSVHTELFQKAAPFTL